jgi:guanosine-3',5'-bis(diphosphate) 3'-pyrophosphohydrolase
MVEEAIRFAAEAHAGQLRKDGRTPFIVHPIAVLRWLASDLGVTDSDILCAAVLHDTVEDTNMAVATLLAMFGPRVAGIVEELTLPREFHGPSVPDSRKTGALVRAMGSISWPAVLVKLSDRRDNLRDSANAPWSDVKRRDFRSQTRRMLTAIERRMAGEHPSRSTTELLVRSLRSVRAELSHRDGRSHAR